ARDTLANGAGALPYAALPEPAAAAVGYDLRIGVVEGDPHEIFGDIRSIEVDGDGNIYALDHQSSEIRVFDPDGAYLRTIARQGRGPSELTAANGMILTVHDTLWVQDHGQWRILGIDLHGRELRQFPMPVRAFGYVWDGTIDERGRFWNQTSHSDVVPGTMPEMGLNEGA